MPPIFRRSARLAAVPNIPQNDGTNHQPPLVSGSNSREGYLKKDPVQRPGLVNDPLSDTPPVYTIDLSLSPVERYVDVATDFKDNLVDLIGLFDEVAESLNLAVSIATVKWLAKIFLRHVHSDEQTEELRGISKAVGVEMYLLVAFNTLLDLFMGCTSGGMSVSNGDDKRMFHFRTLDWGMAALRKVVVQFEYVKSPHGEVVARSVGYVGFVGILTGVRPDFSLSLNFRGCHNNSDSIWANVKYYGNHLSVLMGFRPSIASRLREYIIPREGKILPTLEEFASRLPSTTTTACYITACDGDVTTILEKDLNTAQIRSACNFVTVTNHDQACERDISLTSGSTNSSQSNDTDDILDESIDRKSCLENRWRTTSTLRRKGSRKEDCVTIEDLQKWMGMYPTVNECTHFAAIMDPKEGDVVWCRRWMEPFVGPENAKFDRGALLSD